LQDAEEKKQESLKRLIDAENKKLEAYMEAENIISLAKNDSFFEYNEIIEQAQEDALKIKKEALKLKDIYKKEVEVNNNNKILELALFTTKKMLKTKITKNENLKFIDEFKKDLSKKNNNKHKK
jgi:F0F1-type ATP synthase membrane subunit b/b'